MQQGVTRRAHTTLPVRVVLFWAAHFSRIRTGVYALLCFAITAVPSAVAATEWQSREWTVMTTRAFLEFRAPGTDARQHDAVFNAVAAEFERINAVFSPWLESSELARINRLAAADTVTVSPEMFAMFQRAGEFNRLTGGAFDASFAAAGKLYDFRAQQAPDAQALASAQAAVGWQHVRLNESTRGIRYSHAGTRVDFGGIAKGYAIDRAVAVLRAHGIAHAYVALGGDSFVLGERDGRPWQIGIRHPRQANTAPVMIPASNLAVSTSGDYERFFERNGERIHHILTPGTGKPAQGLVSVTIIANDSTTADALSTGVFVMGKEKGLALINTMPDISAILIDENGHVSYSDDLVPPSSVP
jgi:thiamine biosynthesis lipoprotein